MIGSVLNHLWQSTMVAASLGVLAWCLRRHTAAVRYRLWFLASLKFLLPISVLSVLIGPVHFDSKLARSVIPTLQVVVSPFDPALRPDWMPTVTFLPAAQNAALPAPATAARTPSDALLTALPRMLFCAWLAGAAFLLARWVYQWFRVVGLIRASDLMPIAAPVPVRRSTDCAEPGLVGIAHPILLLPQGIRDQLTAAQLQAVIQHELAHLRRRDNLTAALHRSVEAVFWFFLPVWWIGRRMLFEREAACDEAVIANGCDPATYADTILTICRLYLRPAPPLSAGVAGADLKRRIEAIMAPCRSRPLGTTGSIVITAAAALALSAQVAAAMTVALFPTLSQRSALSADRNLTRQLLRQGQYAALEARLSNFQRAYEAGSLDDFSLLQEFNAFLVADASLPQQFDGWIAARPDSYSARTARGMFFLGSGLQTRGDRFTAYTTQEQLRGMRAYLLRAKQDLEASLELTAKPMVSYNLLIRISMEYGHQDQTHAYLNAALQLDPAAFIARRPYMRSLGTRWGGSVQQMQEFLDLSRDVGLSAIQIHDLDVMVRGEKIWRARWPDVQTGAAVDDQ
ncbi:MAG TPA: M56 family metallopeptidase [Steroidobacteraceae bacterium]|jgi:beta-lactamase regulating signal transducer with metallopeptidase domain